jgi:thymidylate synthase
MRDSRKDYESFASAYLDALREILARGQRVPSVIDPTSVGSTFGSRARPSTELLGYGFRLVDPMASLFSSPIRRVNLAFCVGLLIWTLRGSDAVSEIAFYNPRGRDFSDDGVSLRGAFGKRLFAWEGSLNQLDVLAKRLEEDPSTRRAVAFIGGPNDNARVTRDYPCALAVQFVLRDGALHAFVLMRSQSAYSVLPYDVFLFSRLQSWLAARLGVGIGFYEHQSVSLHLYQDEIELASEVLDSPCRPLRLKPMSAKPEETSQLIDFEERCRHAALAGDRSSLPSLARETQDQSSFFESDARRVILFHAAQGAGWEDLASEAASGLSVELRDLLETRQRHEEGLP